MLAAENGNTEPKEDLGFVSSGGELRASRVLSLN